MKAFDLRARAKQNVNDLETAQGIAAGDPNTMEAFVQEHYASVLRFMRHLTRRIEDAEDLTQHAFLTARTKASSFKGNASLRTWLHRVAYHEYTHWKRRQRKTDQLSPTLSSQEPGYAACLDAIDLLDALHRLPDHLRETFLLHEVQDLSLQDVAKVLGKPVGTVKSRLFNARRMLRTALEGGQEDTHHGEPALESH
jgi:RNA polymerase sigma-70 factor (ECF subfamily)